MPTFRSRKETPTLADYNSISPHIDSIIHCTVIINPVGVYAGMMVRLLVTFRGCVNSHFRGSNGVEVQMV